MTLDALHTQQETAQIIVQERGADYLLTVKGNQPGIAQTLKRHGACRRAFPPSTGHGLGGAVRDQPGASRSPQFVAVE